MAKFPPTINSGEPAAGVHSAPGNISKTLLRGKLPRMTKRKLRNCSQCGVRHGPPFGKYCGRLESAFDALNEEMSGADGAGGGPESGPIEENSKLLGASVTAVRDESWSKDMETRSTCGGVVSVEQEIEDFAKFATGASGSAWQLGPDVPDCQEPAPAELPARSGNGRNVVNTSSGEPLPFQFVAQAREHTCSKDAEASRVKGASRRAQPPPFVEGTQILGRLDRLENVVGKVCGVYQATMERFAHLANAPQYRPAAQETIPEAAGAAAAEPLPPKQPVKKEKKFEWDPFDLESTLGDDWTEFHGREMWKAAEERRKKNPFNHVAYLKKGEKVETFESLMIVTFKTLQQFADAKYDVSGVIKHGLMMAEKASKNVLRWSHSCCMTRVCVTGLGR